LPTAAWPTLLIGPSKRCSKVAQDKPTDPVKLCRRHRLALARARH